jgi:glutamate--cysteine ligase catalytic subunit
MSLDTIFNGKAGEFPGLIPLVRSYLDSMQVNSETRCKIGSYLDLISQRASGKVMTPAAWMRNFVQTHPDYKKDSVVSPIIAYDLMKACVEITHGSRPAPELLGKVKISGL